MCGIAGVVRYPEAVNDADCAAVAVMTERLAHRGPDGHGLHRETHIVLGHRRLAVVDLSEQAAQPMGSADGRIWLTYNGEIYNFPQLRAELSRAGYLFRSTSDTEVLLHGYAHWGIDALLPRLRGMFAFAICDRAHPEDRGGPPRVYLARDALGIKPLYVAQDAGGLSFASEVRALVAAGRAAGVDPQALLGFLALGAVPAPLTIVAGVRCLAPGHYLEVRLAAGTTVTRCWDTPESEPAGPAPDLAGALADSVARHLVADIPVGVFLSGGVDSAALVALASRAGQRVRTLTVALPGEPDDEAPLAEATARRYASEHQVVRVGPAELTNSIQRFLAAMDQPSIDGLNTYLVAAAAARAGLRVALSGLGADEVFAGYRHHRLLARHREIAALARLPRRPAGLLGQATAAFGRARRADRWERWGYLGAVDGATGLYLGFRGLFPPRRIAALLGVAEREVRDAVAEMLAHVMPTGTGVAEALRRIELRRYLHDQLLRDADVFAMAHAVEVRVPYLDSAVLAAAARAPRAEQVARRVNKPALVRALGDPHIDFLARRPKTGFTLPMATWLRTRPATADSVGASGLLDRRAVAGVWADFDAGALHWSRPWALLVAAEAVGPERFRTPVTSGGIA